MNRPIAILFFAGCALALAGGACAAPTTEDDKIAAKPPVTAAAKLASAAHAPQAAGHAPPSHEAAFRPRELARDDPARAHARFDEHVRNAERERAIQHLHEHDFHVADVRHFHEPEWAEWRSGHWHHDVYDGRLGWYYEVGGVWYPYAAPVFPYPTTVAPLIYDEIPPEEALPAAAPLPPLPHVAYHCGNPAGFYPTLTTCDTEWVAITAH
jgi:hypothetical protein